MRRRNYILLVSSFLALNFLVFVSPYFLNGWIPPVGWDTAFYIRNMRMIDEWGLFQFFLYENFIHFYSVFEYFVSIFLQSSFVLTEKLLPIFLGVSISLINMLTVKRFYNSWKLELLTLIFSIVNNNIMRLVQDLHRNLFSYVLVLIALFLILPEVLERSSKAKMGFLIGLLTLAGLSHIETFALAIATLTFLLLCSLWKKSFQKVKLLLLSIIIPFSLVIMLLSPFLSSFMGEHVVFNPSIEFSYRFVAEPVYYYSFLGGALIPFLILGIVATWSKYKKSENLAPLTIFFWNSLAVVASFLPLLHVKIPGRRFLLLVTVPVLSTIGFATFSNITHARSFIRMQSKIKWIEKGISKVKRHLPLYVLMISISLASFDYTINMRRFKPWIANDTYEKLLWISDNVDTNKPSVFVSFFDHGEYTNGDALLYRNWIWATLGPSWGVYFGKVAGLLFMSPTPSANQEMNQTSIIFWNEMKNSYLNGSDIYFIDDWYVASYTEPFLEVYPGVYKVREDVIRQPWMLLHFNAWKDNYNHTDNAYGRNVEWSSGPILEVYEDPSIENISDPTYFQVTFMAPIFEVGDYSLRIRWFDYNSERAPVNVRIDGTTITSLTYNSTFAPQTVAVPLPMVRRGWHVVSLEILGHLDKVHIVSLEYLEIVPM